ncbi:uncharacterized protein BX664DRAFT_343974 [Halteromyces radiatus]|uniref:uncharacterized protein n=1 Tax=Halteromyces radiatus TaxID=101107 RepID=UPI002220F3B5|nr:uncharacterized protein BX664DRAFT_343974 [Halteromyces radiatus]KAI8076811.1 hypothetical protein BX664DRAFT_343974 [Halteromyces radiatus]
MSSIGTKHQFPLTEENLSKINAYSPKYDILSNFCMAGNEAPSHDHHLRIETQNHHHRSSYQRRVRRTSRDVVMESPRLLPFPYHNDSHFLPTAERKQMEHQKKIAGSISDLSLNSQRTHRTTSHTIMSFSPRRAASVPPTLITTRKPSDTSSYSIPLSSSPSSSPLSSPLSSSRRIDSLLTRLISFFKKRKRQSSASSTTTSSLSPSISSSKCTRLPKKSPVWFSEFSVNPPPPNGMTMAAA